jgi:hypothetical protein
VDDALLGRAVDLAHRLAEGLPGRVRVTLAMAARSFFTWVLTWERFFRLRARCLRLCLICFRADE